MFSKNVVSATPCSASGTASKLYKLLPQKFPRLQVVKNNPSKL